MSNNQTVYGIHAVHAAVKESAQTVDTIYVTKDWQRQQRLRQLVGFIESSGLEVQVENKQELARLAGDERHQGVVAQLSGSVEKTFLSLEEIVAYRGKELLLLILDGVQDPHNLGACLRTAEAVGADAVVAPRDRAVGLTAAVRKVASGSAERVPFITVTNLARTLRQLKEEGVWLIGAAGETEMGLYEQDLTGPIAIVMGGEEKGMRRLTREQCDAIVAIPMQGEIESLNVSVAAAVCLYEARRQRSAKSLK
ncbi:MAG: 23S rRNA (guanosine(2251)-2'-O)-methyltransferase RlmB [Gammaproteobacteria bacterium]|nr:23S rRNA (guanosine(2251)-2'-O)-methyltransferase RlmB [Gammaproteobacteria bacterium]